NAPAPRRGAAPSTARPRMRLRRSAPPRRNPRLRRRARARSSSCCWGCATERTGHRGAARFTGRRGGGRSSRRRSTARAALVADDGLAFLVAGAVAERDGDEAVPLVESPGAFVARKRV